MRPRCVFLLVCMCMCAWVLVGICMRKVILCICADVDVHMYEVLVGVCTSMHVQALGQAQVCAYAQEYVCCMFTGLCLCTPQAGTALCVCVRTSVHVLFSSAGLMKRICLCLICNTCNCAYSTVLLRACFLTDVCMHQGIFVNAYGRVP